MPETAFLIRKEDCYHLRWFTPEVEVDLCGHATLASAHILFTKGILHRDTKAKFMTRSGMLYASYAKEKIVLDFPAVPDKEVSAPDGMLDALA